MQQSHTPNKESMAEERLNGGKLETMVTCHKQWQKLWGTHIKAGMEIWEGIIKGRFSGMTCEILGKNEGTIEGSGI